MTPLRQRMIEDMQLRDLSSSTQTAYVVLRQARRPHLSFGPVFTP
jgi:hypothetical protein